ncbi:MAG: hypothetical protein ABJM29_07610 [Rhizobiaceae bacterium]
MQVALKESPDQPARPMRVSEPQSKDDMLILATNRFCDFDTHNRLSLDQFSEAFNLLIGQVSSATRQIVSRRLGHYPFTPRSAALYLALEPINVALPVLAHCQTLGQLDLLRIMDRTDIEHARAIATRLDIGPSLIRQLKSLPDDEVQIALEENDALLGNLETRSADALFAEIDAREVQTALDADLGEVLAISHPDADAERLAEETRTQRTEVTPPPLAPTEPLESQGPDVPLNEAEHALLAAAGRGSRFEMPPMAKPMANDFHFGDAFEKMARAHSHQGMAVLMQKRFSLALDTAQQVLQDKSGDTLAVLLSAAEVQPAQANRIQILTHPSIGLSSHNAMRAMRFFAQLNSKSSLEAVEQWPKARDPEIQHQSVLEDSNLGDTRRGDTRETATPKQQPLQATG